MHHRRLALAVLVALAQSSCGGDSPPPAPSPTATPAPTPTPQAPLAPVTLHHVVLEESVAAPDLPLTSPLDRALPPLPDEGVSGAFLRGEYGADAAAEGLEALERGEGVSGAQVALIEWRVRWGDDGASGEGRFWGLCALPCTVEDSFVATRGHHPADPVDNPRVLFAGRPGAVGPSLSLDGGGLVVEHGAVRLWPAGPDGASVEGDVTEDVPRLEADGVSQETVAWHQHRTLRVASVDSRSLPLSARAEGPPASARVLPDLPARPHVLRRRGVEGVTEIWPWPDAAIFEGGFSVKPDPAASGLQFERSEQRVLWTPTTQQADERSATFVTYSLRRPGGMTATVEPFPLGVDVLASLPALDDRVRLAFAADPDLMGRARQVQTRFEAWNAIVPLPAVDRPDVVYIMQEPTTVLRGGAGGARRSFSVDDAWSEDRSVLRAFARATLGSNAALRTPMVEDWLAHVRAVLLEQDDASWAARAFASAGDDVLGVWREWLQDPARGGNPDPEAFLGFVAGQLPDLAVELRDRLAVRSFALDLKPEGTPWAAMAAELAPPEGPEGGDPESLAAEEGAASSDAGAAAAPPPVPTPTPTVPRSARKEPPPGVSLRGTATVHAAWRWLPWPAEIPRDGRALRVVAADGSTVSWVAQPLTREALAALSADEAARSSLAAGWVPGHGGTVAGEPTALAGQGAEGILIGAWGGGAWEARFEVVAAAPASAP
jgi:hypothetical protein